MSCGKYACVPQKNNIENFSQNKFFNYDEVNETRKLEKLE